MDAMKDARCATCGRTVWDGVCSCPRSVLRPPTPVVAGGPATVANAVSEPTAYRHCQGCGKRLRDHHPCTDCLAEIREDPTKLPVLLTVERRVAKRAGLRNNELVTVLLPGGREASALVAVV